MQATFEHKRDKDDKPRIWHSSDNRTHAHFHSNIELVYVVAGEINVTINGQTMRLKKGDLSAALSYDIHAYQTHQNSEIEVILIPAELVKSFSVHAKGCSFANPFLMAGKHDAELAFCIARLQETMGDVKIHNQMASMTDIDWFFADIFYPSDQLLKAKGYCYSILAILSAALTLKEREVAAQADMPRRILHYLQQHFSESLDLNSIATTFGYNSQYFSRFFTAWFGCGLHEYVNALRVKHAASLLKESDASITDIALDAGFETQRTFNRAFKQVFGVTPTAFKRL